MMSYDNFTKKIQKVIEECSYPFFVVQQDFTKLCTCVNSSISEADPKCKKCLGTGHKVKIKIVYGASYEEMKLGGAGISSNSRIAKHYYVNKNYNLYQDNYIIDENELYYIYRISNQKGIHNEYTHQEIMAILHVNDHDTILKNCLEVINKFLPKKKRDDFPWLQ